MVRVAAPDLAKLHVPTGFRIARFAENVGDARILAIGPDGSVYVTRREEGAVLMFKVGASRNPAQAIFAHARPGECSEPSPASPDSTAGIWPIRPTNKPANRQTTSRTPPAREGEGISFPTACAPHHLLW